MTRFARRWVGVLLLVAAPAVFGQTARRIVPEDQPNAETLKRLAQQLQGGNGQLPNDIDPELLKLAAKYLEKNPELLKDPKFQEQVKQWQQQAKNDPNGFAQQLKQQNPNLSQDQIDNLKKQFQQSNPNGFQPPKFDPPPNITPPMPPINPPDPIRPRPPENVGPQPLPPTPLPGQQPNPFNPNGQPPNPQSQQWQPPEDKAQAKAEYQQVVGLWENNFGSIDNTPALKQSLVDMFSGEGKGPDGNGNNPLNNGGKGNAPSKPWGDGGNGSNGQQSGFVNWLKNSGSGGTPNWWKNMTNWNQNTSPPPNMGSGWKPPQTSGGGGFGSGGGAGGFDLSSGAWPVVIFVAVLVIAVGGFMLWRYWPQIQARMDGPKPVGGLGAWTIDPRNVKDRETLVKAFDYLSVLICGDGARVWNHMTIADAFRENVPGAAPFADPLARLYALARYSPANEPISPADIAEARGYLCRLAEVQA